jgi:hypothetical protein
MVEGPRCPLLRLNEVRIIMTSITVKKHIEAPVEDVFTTATDFANAGHAIDRIEKIEMLTDGPVGLGTRFRETRHFYGKEVTEEMEVTAFERPRRYVLSSENHGCRYNSEFLLKPSASGTEIEMRFEAYPVTVFARIMSFLTRPLMKKMMEHVSQDLEDLKSSVERKDAGSGNLG